MPYRDPEIRKQRQAEAARLRRAQRTRRDDGGTTGRRDARAESFEVLRIAAAGILEAAERGPEAEDLPPNPVRAIREGLGLKRPAFAQVLGVGYNVAAGLELGYAQSIPPHVLASLGAVSGVNTDAIQQAYWQWRVNVAASLRGRLPARARGGMPRTYQKDPSPLSNRNSDENHKEADHE